MKIRFISYKLGLQAFTDGMPDLLLGAKNKRRFGEFVCSYIVFNSVSEAKRYEKQGFLQPPKNALHMIKALNHNKEFSKFILQKRLEEHIKIAHSDKLVKRYIADWNRTQPEEIIDRILKDPIITETSKYYGVDRSLLQQIPTIIRYGCIFLPLFPPEVTITPEYRESKEGMVEKANRDKGVREYKEINQIHPQSININVSANVSVNQIKKILDKNKTQIERLLSSLKNDTFEISERDYKIFNLRALTPPKPHKEIADIIKKEYGTEETAENVKRIYCTTRKKISSLFSPKQ